MDKSSVVRKLLAVIYASFCIWFFGPILMELFSEPPEGDEVGLAILLCVLIAISFASLGLWLTPEKLKTSKRFTWIIAFEIVLIGIIIFLFTYSSWLLLVTTLAVFYIWIKRLIKRKNSNVVNLTWISVLSLLISVYVFLQLIP